MQVFIGYKFTRHPLVSGVVAVFMCLTVAVYAASNAREYPQVFVTETTPVEVTDPSVKAYLQLVNGLDHPDWRARAEALYAEELYYSDTFMMSESRAEIVKHMGELREGRTFKLIPLDVMQGEQGTYIVWSIETGFSVLGREIDAASIGVTLFRFNAAGEIEFQQDFWDSTQGFYQHVPLLGGALRTIRDRVAGQ